METLEQDVYKKIGARIREARLEKMMSQQDLAIAAHLSLPHISVIELGKAKMQLSTFIRIAEALQVSTDDLLRPNIPQVNTIYQSEFQEIIGDCTPAEIDSIFEIVREIKTQMHSRKTEYDE